MSVLVPFVIVPAGIAIAAGASGGTPASAPAATGVASNGGIKASSAVSPGSTVGDLLTGQQVIGTSTAMSRARAGVRLAQITESGASISDRAKNSAPTSNDAELQAKIDTIKQYSKQAYDKLSAQGRKEGADALNRELKIEPPLDGTEDFESVLHKIAPYVGATAGGAVGGALGGPAGAALGAVVGKYLGVKYEELLAKAIPEIRDFLKSKWDWISDKAEGAYHAVASWFDAAF